MRLRAGVVALWGLLSAAVLPATPLEICLVNEGLLAPSAAAELRSELRRLLPAHRITYVSTPCSSEGPSVVITFRAEGSRAVPDALGAARIRNGRIEPEVEVFLAPVERLVGGGWERVGRALARVAAHETLHYLRQQTHHDQRGVLTETFDAKRLRDDDCLPFIAASN